MAKNGQMTATTESLNAQIGDITSQRERLSERLVTLEARYRSQFVAMDMLVATLQSTGNYLQQQLDSLPEISVK